MKRLTFEGDFCEIAMCQEVRGGSFCEDGDCTQRQVWERLKQYEDTGLEPEDIKRVFNEEAILKMAGNVLGVEPNRLRELVQANQEGRCVVLPCKPSDVTVYQLRSKKHARGVGVSPRRVFNTSVWGDGRYELQHQGLDACLDRDLGKTWFLTKEEAEAALKEEEE